MKLKSLLSLLLLCGQLAGTQVYAEERILSFHSEISIAQDASMEVRESIRVQTEGVQIRRGIFRDFPTDYRDRVGNRVVVGFRVVAVTRDGRTEPWRQERRGNGVRVYVGDADVVLPPDVYDYVIHYRTKRQLGFFADHDELYWNVTGNGWAFPIEQASARVVLPASVPAVNLVMEGYTGAQGDQGQAYTAGVVDGAGTISSTARLPPASGLTLAFSFPKGIVAEPTRQQQAGYLLHDNLGLLLGLLALGATTIYLYLVWNRYGRDPQPGVIFPHYEAPQGLSPASARYIRRMGYDNLAFTAAIVNLAVKGHLKIENVASKIGEALKGLFHVDIGGTYVLHKQASTQPLAPGEAALMEKLFSKEPSVTLKQENHPLLQQVIAAHRASLKRDYYGSYFKTNGLLLLPSLLGCACIAVLAVVLNAFVPLLVFILVLIAVLHIGFAFLMPAHSAVGRGVLDQLEGFREFLEVAEKDDLQRQHPPELTPALFERFLPYAIAMDVEQAWAKKFTRVFESLEASTGLAYHPVWYSGAFHHGDLADFTRGVSRSFNSAIAAAATSPGTSSGAGGGGHSGRGGGGGGGGGW